MWGGPRPVRAGRAKRASPRRLILVAAFLAAATPASAGVVSDCRADYRALCSGVALGSGGVLACLREHAAQLSAACRAALAGRDDSTAPRADLAYGSDPAQVLDVYAPPGPQAAPVIVMVHGGGWAIGDKAGAGVAGPKAAHWNARGYIVVSVNYRMIPAADPLEQAQDVARALAFVQAQAPGWGGDPRRTVLMGHSAGAHLVALLAANPALAAAQGARPWTATVALDSAAFDVPAIMGAPHPRLYDRAFGSDTGLWRRASPIHAMNRPASPLLLVCTTRSCPQADAFRAALAAKGSAAEILRQDDLNHMQVNRTLGEPGAYTDAVDAFLQRQGLP